MAGSFTAQTMALQRALETARPRRSRLFVDPLAEALLGQPLRTVAAAARIPVVGALVARAYDTVWPGPRPSAVARTRLIDDTVTEQVAAGVEQVVLLGAGFDSRAWRLECLRAVSVVEVDLPDTQAAKRRAISRAGADSGRVTFLPVDLEAPNLEQAVRDAGFTPSARTLFVWEGVTNYLSAAAVDATVAAIRALAGPDGLLLFTYVHAGVLDGSVVFPEARRWVASVAKLGEPWTFGLVPEKLPEFLTERGYEMVWEESTAQAGQRYFGAAGRRDRGSALYRVALARLTCRG